MIISGGVPTLLPTSKVEHEEDGSQAVGTLGDHQANGNNGSTNPRRRIVGSGVQAHVKVVPGMKKNILMELAVATKL